MSSKYHFLFTTVLLLAWSSTTSNGQVTHSFTEPVETRELAAAQPDVVGALFVEEGSRVSADMILGELDNRILKQSLEIAELRANSDSRIDAAQATFEIKKQRYNKLKPMLEKGHANPAEVEKSLGELEEAKAELQIAKEKQIEFQLESERIKTEIETRTIRSPFDGIVTEVHCRPGEFVASEQRQLFTVVKLDQLRVRFYLLSKTVDSIQVNQTVSLSIGHQHKPIQGVIEYIAPIVDPESGTIRVDVLIDNQDQAYRSGTNCVWHGRLTHKKDVAVSYSESERN